MQRVLVLGHSFIRRMERVSMDFKFQIAKVRYCGYIGSTPLNLIDQALNNFHKMVYRFSLPHVVVIVLGTNDVCSLYKLPPWELADKLIKLATKFRNCGVQEVMLVECLPRFGRKSFRRSCPFAGNPAVCAVSDMERVFAQRMEGFNNRLQEQCKATPGITLVRLKGLHLEVRAQLEDGLHLSATGREKLRKAIRKEVIVALLRCSNKKL